MSVFSSKKTQQGVYAAEEAKEKTQTIFVFSKITGRHRSDFIRA